MELAVMTGAVSETGTGVGVSVALGVDWACEQPVIVLIIIPNRKKIVSLLFLIVLNQLPCLLMFFLKTNILILLRRLSLSGKGKDFATL